MKRAVYFNLDNYEQQSIMTKWRNAVGNIDEPKWIRFERWLEKYKHKEKK